MQLSHSDYQRTVRPIWIIPVVLSCIILSCSTKEAESGLPSAEKNTAVPVIIAPGDLDGRWRIVAVNHTWKYASSQRDAQRAPGYVQTNGYTIGLLLGNEFEIKGDRLHYTIDFSTLPMPAARDLMKGIMEFKQELGKWASGLDQSNVTSTNTKVNYVHNDSLQLALSSSRVTCTSNDNKLTQTYTVVGRDSSRLRITSPIESRGPEEMMVEEVVLQRVR